MLLGFDDGLDRFSFVVNVMYLIVFLDDFGIVWFKEEKLII